MSEPIPAPGSKDAFFYDKALPALLVLIILAVYGTTVAPTVAFWDAGEFIATSYILGIPHPPATPLYVLVGRVFSLFPLATPAVRVNFLSTLPAIGAILFLYLTIVRTAKRWTNGSTDFVSRLVTHVGPFIGCLVAAFMSTYWTDSIEAEVYSLSIFIWSFSVWLAIRWADSPNRDADRRPLLLVAYLLSLSIGIHLGTYLALPPFLIFLFVIDRKVLLDVKLMGMIIAVTLIGVTVHAYLPIRSMLNPAINEAEPTTLSSFMDCVLRKQYKPMSPFERQATWDFQFAMFWRYFKEQFISTLPDITAMGRFRDALTGILPLIGCAGMLYHFRKNRETFVLLGSQFLIGGLFLIFYMNFTDHEVRERDYFYGPAFFFFAVWLSFGFSSLFESAGRWLAARRINPKPLLGGAAIVALVFPAFVCWEHFHTHDRRGDFIARDYAYNMLIALEKDALIFTNGDNDTFPLWYLQEVEGIRRDVRILNLSLLNTPWYIKQLKNLEPKVPISFSDQEIDQLRPFRREEQIYLVKDIASMDIVRTNNFQRPIYFAVTVADLMGFDKGNQLTLEGLVFKFHGTPQAELVDEAKTVANLTQMFRYQGILGADGELVPDVYRDENTTRLISNYSAAWARIAFARRQRGEKDGAIEALANAGRISPDYRPYLAAMGALYLEAGRLDEAKEFYRKNLAGAETVVEKYDATMGLGAVHERARELDSAEARYREALAILPQEQEPYLSLYQMFTLAGDLDRGASVLREWLAKNPADTKTRERLQMLERQMQSAGRDTTVPLP
ncbi:MAG: protein O-mannosyl-transferase family [bacterium]